MTDLFNEDFEGFIKGLNNQNVEYILIEGMAGILHGYVRATGDMDIWVNKTKDNYQKLVFAFKEFRMPVFDMSEENFLSDQYDVWMFGVSPVKIEIMTSLKGLEFKEAFKSSQIHTEENIPIRFLDLQSLIKAKKASGRFKDLDDIEQLTKGSE
jgi:hypothetical protein